MAPTADVRMIDFDYKIIRSARRKTWSIAVSRENKVTIVVPENVTDQHATKLIESKSTWIKGKIELNRERGHPQQPRRFVAGELFRYLGQDYRLEVVLAQPQGVSQENGELRVSLAPSVNGSDRAPQVANVLKEWYLQRALETLQQRMAVHRERLHIKPRRVKVKNLRSRWGSCSSKGNISFDWKIIMAPLDVIDYVVVHELCHLVHHNHSRTYWNLVQSILPDYRARKDWLRLHGHRLTF